MTTTATTTTTIYDLPDVILSNIFSTISNTRTRNAMSLVCGKWLILERSTRTHLTLRGNACNLHMMPTCFRSVTHLDLSFLSPWGHSLLSSPHSTQSSSSSSSSSAFQANPFLLARLFRQAFPSVTCITLYARTPSTLHYLAHQWPNLTHVTLVRWHQRTPSSLGADFWALFDECKALCSLDLSSFYYWTEDIPPVLQAHGDVAGNLGRLNLLTESFSEGFKSDEIRAITASCPNLKEFLVVCMFDPRFNGFLGNETLVSIPLNCPKLRLLHLGDASSLSNTRGDPEEEGYSSEDAKIDRAAWVEFFSGLPLIEELVLDVCKNVRNSGVALEVINSKCLRLRSLKVGQFHGLCMAIGSQLDGIAVCERLESLSIKNSADLTDMGLIAIARGCSRLAKFEVEGCKRITMRGMRTLACLLRKTLVEVKISCCKNLDAAASLQALEPVRDRIRRLHIDCIWDGGEECTSAERVGSGFGVNELEEAGVSDQSGEFMELYGSNDCEDMRERKKCKYTSDAECSYVQSNGSDVWCKTWPKLEHLSLWIGVGELLTPLGSVGLEDCPLLEEIHIKVEGDCRERPKPSEHSFGLISLARYPRLSKMQLNCGDTIGYALTAPSGQMDLSLWERFYLKEIGNLSLSELDYWPPQDTSFNQRSLSLPAAGLLAQCNTLRKLFIHGTAHEHFLRFLLDIENLRDVQLREDYYPAPENDMSTEMRVDSCCRFEEALNGKPIPD